MSNNDIDDADNQESDSDGLSQDKQPKLQPIVTIPGSLRLSEGSAGEGGGSCPQCNIYVPARYVQGKIQWYLVGALYFADHCLIEDAWFFFFVA